MSPPPLIHFDLFIIKVLEDFRLKESPSERERENKSGPLLLFTWLSYLLSRFLVPFTLHDFHVTKYCFSIQFLPHSKHSHFLVRFESLIMMLMTTHLYLNMMQCRLVYKYQLSPISDSSWRCKLGQSLSWRWQTPWKCYLYAPAHVFIFKTTGISTHDLHYLYLLS